jgi:hypothetical protein
MSQHTDHAVVPANDGWSCEACADPLPDLHVALGHVVAHQYQVAPMKPLPEHLWGGPRHDRTMPRFDKDAPAQRAVRPLRDMPTPAATHRPADTMASGQYAPAPERHHAPDVPVKRYSAFRCQHSGPHETWLLERPGSRLDGEFVDLCRACADLPEPFLWSARV